MADNARESVLKALRSLCKGPGITAGRLQTKSDTAMSLAGLTAVQQIHRRGLGLPQAIQAELT
jgi:hypothetical protein